MGERETVAMHRISETEAVPVSGSAESDGAAWIEFLLVSAVGCYQPGLHNVCFWK